MTAYLGFSCSQHDPAIAVVDEDGAVAFAEANERALKCKRGWHAPPDAFGVIEPILDAHAASGDVSANLTWSNAALRSSGALSRVSRLAIAGIERLGPAGEAALWRGWYLRHALYRAPRSASELLLNLDVRLRERRGFRHAMDRQTWDHHLCHAATACYSSPFDDALCVVMDGMGEGSSSAVFSFRDGRIERLDARQLTNLASLGHFYSQVCYAVGFDPHAGEEWKVMGLAALGTVDDDLYRLLRPAIRVAGNRVTGSRVTGCRLSAPAVRAPWFEAIIGRREWGYRRNADLARTAQKVFEDVLLEFLHAAHRRWGGRRLILTGGCALNSSANGKIVSSTPFEALHVPMAPGDDGNAIGAALLAWQRDHPGKTVPRFASPYLGSSLSTDVRRRLERFGLRPSFRSDDVGELCEHVARALAGGAIVGWARGRAEFGPRALGHRSILADPRSVAIRDRLNASVKFREEFRPFAPSILHEHGNRYFQDYACSPYMERAFAWRPGMAPQGVAHADGTGRLQSVTPELNPAYHRLISAFHRRTGVPILLNTSFNVMGRPIIHDVEDAVGVFLTSGMDVLVIEDTVFESPHPGLE